MHSHSRAGHGALALLAAWLLSACGGGDAVTPPAPPPPPPPPVAALTKAEAFRFLNQASFGATETEAARLISMGSASTAYAAWIDAELAKPASTLLPAVEAAYPNPVPMGFNIGSLNAPRVEKWFDNTLRGSDQLRQRVAWALSQIFVVSQIGALQNLPSATADFYDLLARDALGDYRTLLRGRDAASGDGRLSVDAGQPEGGGGHQPAAGRELCARSDAADVDRPGGAELDGSLRRDAGGQPIPTYDQSIIEGFARVFTGWKWACPTTNAACTFANVRPQLAPLPGYNQILPMKLYAAQHETGTKKLLSGVTLPANQSGEADLQAALDTIANHPNVAPFMSRQLIQKLVTSNPSAAYVRRIATVFNNDGSGRRGNLGAVVRAILLDAEARPAWPGCCAGGTGQGEGATAAADAVLACLQRARSQRQVSASRATSAVASAMCSDRARACRPRCSTSSVLPMHRQAKSPTRAWWRRNCSWPPNT